jgi:tRNA1(Val) A37 N6-methylase TrmN6
MPVEGQAPDVTDDAALGGRLRLLQPRRGHRFGHDAILLAAATDARAGDRAVDLGAGVGTAGLALAARVADVNVTLVERDRDLAVRAVALDVTGAASDFTAAGLAAGSADCVLMNPPFHESDRHRGSPEPTRRAAHEASAVSLPAWIKAAARLLRPGGKLTLIYRADGAAEVLAALNPVFGACKILPVYPKPDAIAIRVIVGAVKDSRGPLELLPGLILAGEDGRPTPSIDDILRRGAGISLRVRD